eukprot:365506-Chlamydomonas_euryale.AAC.15
MAGVGAAERGHRPGRVPRRCAHPGRTRGETSEKSARCTDASLCAAVVAPGAAAGFACPALLLLEAWEGTGRMAVTRFQLTDTRVWGGGHLTRARERTDAWVTRGLSVESRLGRARKRAGRSRQRSQKPSGTRETATRSGPSLTAQTNSRGQLPSGRRDAPARARKPPRLACDVRFPWRKDAAARRERRPRCSSATSPSCWSRASPFSCLYRTRALSRSTRRGAWPPDPFIQRQTGCFRRAAADATAAALTTVARGGACRSAMQLSNAPISEMAMQRCKHGGAQGGGRAHVSDTLVMSVGGGPQKRRRGAYHNANFENPEDILESPHKLPAPIVVSRSCELPPPPSQSCRDARDGRRLDYANLHNYARKRMCVHENVHAGLLPQADLNGDGHLEVVVATQDLKIQVWTLRGHSDDIMRTVRSTQSMQCCTCTRESIRLNACQQACSGACMSVSREQHTCRQVLAALTTKCACSMV